MEVTPVAIPPYPAGTPGAESKQGTYWHKLSPANQAALTAVETFVATHNIDCNDLAPYALDHRLTLLRYLRANNFDVNKATKHMTDNIAWRTKHEVKDIMTKMPNELLGFPMEELTKVFPHWHYGFDKTGRPVVYKQYGKFDATKVKALAGGSFDNIMKYHIWEQETAAQLFHEQTFKRGELVETLTGIIDVKDMRLGQITRDFLALVQLLAEVDQKQYPETMGRIYILNAPSIFPIVWRGVRPWLDPITAAKIFVLGDKREYEPILADFIGKENLPANYAGDLPALSVDMHPYQHSLNAREAARTAAPSVAVAVPVSPAAKKDFKDSKAVEGSSSASQLDSQMVELKIEGEATIIRSRAVPL